GLELLTNPVDQMDQFFNPGTFNSASLTVSRNMESTNFSINISRRTLSGVLDGLDGSDRKSVRMAIDHKFHKDLTISVNGFYSNLTRDDVRQSIGSPFFGLTFMGGEADLEKLHAPVGTKTLAFPDGLPVDVGGELFIQPDPTTDRTNPLYEPENWFRENTQTRVLGGGTLSYSPVNWFRLDGNMSYDRSNREVVRWRPIGFQSVLDLATTVRGRIQKIPAYDEALNGSVTASLSRSFLNDELTVRTKVRALFERTEFQDTNARGDGLAVRGVLDLNIADSEDLRVNSDLQQVRSEGYSFITGIDFKDRYIVDFLARRDGSSLFGPDQRWHNYFRIAGAYRLSQEPWWFTDKIQEFKIRSSYGTAGNRPRFNARFETWTVTSGNVSKLRFGNKDLKPEFAKEFEIGLDMTFLDRFTLEVTRASTTVENQLLRVPLASFFGYTEQWQNAGTLETDTWEASLTGLIKQSRDVSWTFGANIDRSTNKITKLDVAPYSFQNFGTSQSPQIFRVQEGLEYGALWGTTHIRDPQDLLVAGVFESELEQFKINDEGYVVWTGVGNEVTEGISKQLWGTHSDTLGSGQVYNWGMPLRLRDEGNNLIRGRIGSTIPDFNFGVFSTFQWKGFSIYGLLEAQVGGDIYSQTAAWGYSENQGRTALSDMAGVPDELKKPTAYNNAVGQSESDTFIFDATYYKLRELSVKYTFNRNQLSGVFGGLLKSLSIGFIGRNLF
ncbi:hypothetical protein MJD09_21535, partial [bacterium]|nr:hypothetical protein [bacterium]